MKQNISFLILAMIIGSLGMSQAGALEIDIGDLLVGPENPTPLSTLNLTLVLDEEANELWISLQECNGNTGVCFPPRNISFSEKVNNNWEATVQLEEEDATYVQFNRIDVLQPNGWTTFAYTEGNTLQLYLEDENGENGNGETNGNEDNGDDTSTPGFELLVLISAITLAFLFMRRKR
jgi:hypothetical protein